MKVSSHMFSAVFSILTACMLGIAFLYSLVVGFGYGLSDVNVPGLILRLPDTWSPLEIHIFLLALLLLAGAFILLEFTRISHADHAKRLRIFLTLAGIFLCLQLLLVFGLHTIQNTDAFEVQDQALAIARGIHTTVDYTKSSYFEKYGNNDLYLIFCIQVFRLCLFLHIRAYRTVFALLNLAAVDAAIFMTCRAIWLLKGPKAALKVFLLNILNPLNILLLCWPYTCTLSMPLMMASLWMAAAFLKGNSDRKMHAAELLIIGITAVIGYYFRPTAVFPVIALLLCTVCAGIRMFFRHSCSFSSFFRRKHGNPKKAVRRLLLTACAVLLMAGTSTAIRTTSLRLDPMTDTKFPKVYWLMLGACGTGRVNGEEMQKTLRMDTIDQKKAANLETIRKALKKRGVVGNLQHYLEKTGLTWSDGTAEYTNRTAESENSLPWLYRLLNGPGAGILFLWCQAYRILLLFMALSGILMQLSADRTHAHTDLSCSGPGTNAFRFIFQMCVITLLGGFVFYTFWEGKPVYSYPFLPYLVVLGFPAWEKACRIHEQVTCAASFSANRIRKILAVLLLSVTGIGLAQKYVLAAGAGIYDTPSIVCESKALPSWLSIPEGQTLTQGFCPSGAFNTIRIRVKFTDNGESGDLYRILVVSGDTGENGIIAAYRTEDILADETVDAGQIKNGFFTVTFPTVSPEKNETFRVLVTNLSSEGKSADGMQSSIRFGTRLCYVMDEYKGDCVLNGNRQSGDLLMRVSFRNQ